MTRVVTIRVEHVHDEVTRDSVEQEPGTYWCYDDESIHTTPEQRQEVLDRIEAWKRDEWWYIGVVVTVTVSIPYATTPDGRIRTATDTETESLWGIESDSDEFSEKAGAPPYTIEVAQDLAGTALAELGLPAGYISLIDQPEGTWETPPF